MSATTVSRARSAAPRRTPTRGASAVPRRVSGPVGGRARAQPRPQRGVPAGARALALVRSLPDHSLIDRLVRGRAWIPVLGVLLVGIVAMQVEILKAGTTLGRSLERTASLQSQNESLQAGVAGLADYQRIERLATGMGMVMPSPGLLTFVSSNPGAQVGAGLAGIHAPDPAGFAMQLASQVAAAELIAPSGTGATSQTAGTQSTATAGSASPATGAGTTTSVPPGTSQGAIGSTGTGSSGTVTSASGAATTSTTGGAGSTTGAPTASVAPGGGGAAAGGAGLSATSTTQSAGTSGG